MHRAMRELIANVLARVGREGLPGEHHFYVTFDTTRSGVDMPPRLAERHPDEMTIVLQHWFQDLTVSSKSFSVVLSFDNTPEKLTIPFDAITSFVDPSAEFGLRFQYGSHQDGDQKQESPMIEIDDAGAEADHAPGDGGKVVRLDSFRKPKST